MSLTGPGRWCMEAPVSGSHDSRLVGRDPGQAVLCRRPADRVAVGRVEIRLVSMDEYSQHVALPKLFGAPAYARPAIAVAHTPRPLDADDLPIVAEMGPDELALLAAIPAPDGRVPAVAPARMAVAVAKAPAQPLRPRPFLIRAFADRIRHPRP